LSSRRLSTGIGRVSWHPNRLGLPSTVDRFGCLVILSLVRRVDYRSGDEEVVRMGGDPQAYAEGILQVCEFYLQPPVNCMSGVSGSNLKNRIEAIIPNRIAVRVNFAKKMASTVAGAAVLGMLILVGMIHGASPQAQSQSGAASQTVPPISICRLARRCSVWRPVDPGHRQYNRETSFKWPPVHSKILRGGSCESPANRYAKYPRNRLNVGKG
jgi:hypothetical protein